MIQQNRLRPASILLPGVAFAGILRTLGDAFLRKH